MASPVSPESSIWASGERPRPEQFPAEHRELAAGPVEFGLAQLGGEQRLIAFPAGDKAFVGQARDAVGGLAGGFELGFEGGHGVLLHQQVEVADAGLQDDALADVVGGDAGGGVAVAGGGVEEPGGRQKTGQPAFSSTVSNFFSVWILGRRCSRRRGIRQEGGEPRSADAVGFAVKVGLAHRVVVGQAMRYVVQRGT